ncbi:hypothetical protein P6U16_16740 [Rhizobium sp. 32-5/1]|uniref:hypothetical protein n=1 Tax=Rhizobium sp. 32-5/1 TaxID=3019602 RepID=UPI00240DE77A|nr:hypothetical protein [Rhizobium sp. 32-5/1]WEZ82670.1 hypothetical protein P6U16_16740 [Rhizobium sp. 32-5/1]
MPMASRQIFRLAGEAAVSVAVMQFSKSFACQDAFAPADKWHKVCFALTGDSARLAGFGSIEATAINWRIGAAFL